MRTRVYLGILILLAFVALLALPAHAQFTTITATDIQAGDGSPLAAGSMCWLGTNNAGTAIGYRAGTSGQTITAPVCRDIVSGAVATTYKGVAKGALQVADTTLTQPANVCYKVTVTDTSSGKVVLGSYAGAKSGYDCVQPSGSTWNFDTYTPAGTPGTLVTAGPVGPQGPAGLTFNAADNISFTGIDTFTILRGRVDATQFTGADMCAKVNAAWTYAAGLGLGYGDIDASGFHGRQDVNVSCFASFPATSTTAGSFVGALRLAPDVKIVTSVTQNPPTNIFIDGGGSAWIWSVTGGSTFTTNMGAQFIPSDTFNWATQKAVFQLGYTGGTTNPRGIWFQNVGVGCISPNGAYTSGSIGIYNGLSQEGTGGERVFVYGCTIGIDIENDGSFGGSQNSGPWKQLNIQATSTTPSTETGWIGVAFCKSTSFCDENRGIDGATFSGPGSVGSTAVSVDMSNVAIRNVSSENTYYTVDIGKYHAGYGITLDNIQGEGHTTFNTQAIVHVTAGSITTFTATNIGANTFGRNDYMIQDEGTNGLSFCGASSITGGSPCNGATLLTPNVPLYVVSTQTGYGNSRVVFAPHPGAPNGGISIGGNAATATTASACPTCTGGVFIQTSNTDYTTSAGDKGKLIRMTPAANNVTFNLPATPPSSSWWAVVQSVNLTGFTTSINSNGTNLDGSPTSTTPVTVPQGQNIMIWTNGTSYYSVRWNTPYSGTTGSIGGSALAAGVCASGTVTIAGVVAGQTGRATASDGTDQDNYVVKAYASAANTATVKVCAIVAGTPTAKTYNVRINY